MDYRARELALARPLSVVLTLALVLALDLARPRARAFLSHVQSLTLSDLVLLFRSVAGAVVVLLQPR